MNDDTDWQDLAITAMALERDLAAARARVAALEAERDQIRDALERSVFHQSHYAKLLNGWDEGKRMQFKDADAWLARLAEVDRKGKQP